jgi:hypothetical protein
MILLFDLSFSGMKRKPRDKDCGQVLVCCTNKELLFLSLAFFGVSLGHIQHCFIVNDEIVYSRRSPSLIL